MARTALLYGAAAVVVAAGWLALEETGALYGEAVAVMLLALAPALAPTWPRRAAAAAIATVLAAAVAFDSLRDAPGRLWNGSLEFWDVGLPFAARQHPRMAGAVVFGLFVFALGVSLALVARRPVAAALFTLTGAAWPATLVGAGTARGAPVLAVVLLLLAAGGTRRPIGARGALLAGAVVVVAGLAGASSSALAKDEFLDWKRWDPYDQPDRPVSVAFVWNANYEGVDFPDKTTDVLTVDGVRRPLYWRATTLDTYDGERWREDLELLATGRRAVDALDDALLPDAGRNRRRWLEAEVEIRALRDERLPAPSMPVSYNAPGLGFLRLFSGGVVKSVDDLRRGTRYSVSSYAPRPTPAQLASVNPAPEGVPTDRYLEIARGLVAPRWGERGRAGEMRALLTSFDPTGSDLQAHRPLFEVAQRIAGGRQTPYAAVVALETWLRSEGGFRYDEQPGAAPGRPALVDFVTRGKEGYCQHFAGAMTLMLRTLGIPARVAAGFTSGSYDDDDGPRWTVTDHDAHAWVEVWFDGWGWVPFDPTPGRGQLGGSYSTSSLSADIPAIRDAVNGDGNPNIGPALDIDGGSNVDDGGGSLRRSQGLGLVTLLLLGGAVAVVVIGAAKLVRRRFRYVGSDARRAAAACRAELADFLADQGVSVPASATPAELAAVVRHHLGVDAGRFAAALAAARFAPPREAAPASRRARKELAALLRLLRARLTRIERARGLVSLRSLGLTG